MLSTDAYNEQNSQTPEDINPDTRYYSIITSPTNSKGFISIRSGIDFFQENKADGIDKLRSIYIILLKPKLITTPLLQTGIEFLILIHYILLIVTQTI